MPTWRSAAECSRVGGGGVLYLVSSPRIIRTLTLDAIVDRCAAAALCILLEIRYRFVFDFTSTYRYRQYRYSYSYKSHMPVGPENSRDSGCREYSSATGVVNYSSNFLPLEYSLLFTSGCKFPFPVAVCKQSIDECWNLWKVGASRFHLQLEMDLQGGPKICTIFVCLKTSSNIDQFSNFLSLSESEENW